MVLSYSVKNAEAAASKPSKEKTAATSKKTSSQSVKTNSQQIPSDYEPTRDGPLTGAVVTTTATAKPGMFAHPGMTDISDNPGFFMAQDKTPEPGVPQDIDKLIRPVLKGLFKDVKLVEDIGEQPPRIDGEVEENKLVYVVRQLLDESDVDQLHTELNGKQKWPASPRLGRKPTHGRKEAVMSLFRSTSLRGYSFVIGVNYETQRVTVISYRLGSHYDRLM